MREHPWLILVALFVGCMLHAFDAGAACPGTLCAEEVSVKEIQKLSHTCQLFDKTRPAGESMEKI